MRDQFRLLKLLPAIVTDIQQLLDPDTPRDTPQPGTELLSLWDPDLGALPAGVNYDVRPE
jgi:CRISPR-associated protein Cas1